MKQLNQVSWTLVVTGQLSIVLFLTLCCFHFNNMMCSYELTIHLSNNDVILRLSRPIYQYSSVFTLSFCMCGNKLIIIVLGHQCMSFFFSLIQYQGFKFKIIFFSRIKILYIKIKVFGYSNPVQNRYIQQEHDQFCETPLSENLHKMVTHS